MNLRTIRRAVVIGSGTMGGGIAAHFANAGIPVYLLDVIEPPLDRIKKHKPPPFFTPETAELITAGTLDAHEDWIAEGDWIVEAIIENMEAKRDLVARIDRLRKPGSIVSSNTSGLPIARISANASDDFRKHFIGTHFFNPPRYMKLLEVIPTPDTDPDVTRFVTEFATDRLGKGVVLCKDTPNFIANRLASIGGASLTDFALANDYTIEEVDAIAGPLLGRPKTAAFRLQDLVGLDVASAVGSNLYGLIEGDESREVLRSERVEALRKSQMDQSRLGDKSGAGFYKKDGKSILTLDLKSGQYRPRIEPDIPSLAEAAKIRDLGERVKFVLQQDDKAGALARHVVYGALGYASRRVPEISDDLVSIDRAVKWGFSHDLGPFELWDAIGVRATIDAIDAAPWVREMVDAGHETFYRDGAVYDIRTKSYKLIERDPRQIVLAECPVVKENKGASLRDLGDGVLCLEFHSKMNSIDADVRAMIDEAVRELENDAWRGLVIGNDGADFCVGANLKLLDGRELPRESFADVLRSASKPVVAAPFGRTLGGGVEVCLASTRVVAASETYMGLVEAGVGLIPGAGGCKEMVRRVVSPVMRRTPNADPLPLVQNALQTLASSRVSTSAAEARDLGFLTDADHIVMNRDHLLHEAKQAVLALVDDRQSCLSPDRRDRLSSTCFASGRDVLAALKAGIYVLQQGGYMSEYDAYLSGRLAFVLCGGELSSAEWVSEEYLLRLEREVFAELLAQPKTQERIAFMLNNGKPLRN